MKFLALALILINCCGANWCHSSNNQIQYNQVIAQPFLVQYQYVSPIVTYGSVYVPIVTVEDRVVPVVVNNIVYYQHYQIISNNYDNRYQYNPWLQYRY